MTSPAVRAAIDAAIARSVRKTENTLAAYRAGRITAAERDTGNDITRAVADAEIRQARRSKPLT
jgi:hypothetical protein